MICLFVVGSTFAQKKVDSYIADYFIEGKEYDIQASNKDGELSLYFNVCGESTSDDISFGVKGNDITLFIEALNQAKAKFIEWSDIAKTNNVKDMSKDMDIYFPRITVVWYASKWKFAFKHKLSPRFVVTDNGECLFITTGKVTASDNQYMDEEYYFVLSSKEEFEGLIAKISPENLLKKLNQDIQAKDLFK